MDEEERLLATTCAGIAREQGLTISEAQLAAVAHTLAGARPALLRMRQIRLEFGPFYEEPALATAWLDEMGSRRHEP